MRGEDLLMKPVEAFAGGHAEGGSQSISRVPPSFELWPPHLWLPSPSH